MRLLSSYLFRSLLSVLYKTMVIPNIEILFISQRFVWFKVIIRSGLNYTLAAKYIAISNQRVI